MTPKVDGALVAALYCVALVVRLVPLTFSPLPYNVDGFALARIMDGFGETGRWVSDEANVNRDDLKLPAFSLVGHAVVQMGGLHPLTDLQWFLPILLASVVLPIYLIAVKVTGNRVAGFAAGLFLALFGSFLFLTSAIMKESLALLFVPTIALTFHGRADPRKRAIAFVLLVVLVFLHHVTTLVAAAVVGSLIVLEHRRAGSRGRFSVRRLAADVGSGLTPFLIAWLYYRAVDLPNVDRVSASIEEMVLFVAIAVVLTALVARTWRPRPVLRRRRLLSPVHASVLVPAVAVGAVLVNARETVFPATFTTQPALLDLLPAVLVLAGFALVGYQVLRTTSSRSSDVVMALLVAPAVFLLFGFLRGLDVFSFRITYRGFDFLDFGFAVLAGIGLAYVARRLGRRPATTVPLMAGFLGLLLATTPMAWDTQAVFGVDNVNRPEEFQTLSVLASLGATGVASDQRVAHMGLWWYGFEVDPFLGTELRDREPVRRSEYAIVLERWTTIGAQDFPRPNAILDRQTVEDFLDAQWILYVTGTEGDRIYVARLT